MKVLVYDPFAGISGDMNIGAMVSLGIPETYFKDTVESLGISGAGIEFVCEKRWGIEGVRALVKEGCHDHGHRNLGDISEIINKSRLSENIKKKSLDIFTTIAEAEAKVHGTDIGNIHFHETGAVDSIVDIVCAAAAVEYIKPDMIISRPPELGSGFVECQHGIFPVPPPAVSEILKDVPVSIGNVVHEATTPTGAAILKTLADCFQRTYSGTVKASGYGVGKRDPEIPNLLRVLIIESDQKSGETDSDEAVIITCNIDDMNPELYSNVMKMLFDGGAKDVFQTSVFMKKNRPGTLLTVMADPEDEEKINEILFLETTTAGVRSYRVKQTMLKRKEVISSTKYGKVRTKELYYRGRCISSKPEYDDMVSISEKNRVSLRSLYNSFNHETD